MARKSTHESNSKRYGIYVDHLDGTFGWIVVGNGEPYLAESELEAQKFMKKLLSNDKYSYSRPLSVREFHAFKKVK